MRGSERAARESTSLLERTQSSDQHLPLFYRASKQTNESHLLKALIGDAQIGIVISPLSRGSVGKMPSNWVRRRACAELRVRSAASGTEACGAFGLDLRSHHARARTSCNGLSGCKVSTRASTRKAGSTASLACILRQSVDRDRGSACTL